MKYDVYIGFIGYKVFNDVEANSPEEAYKKMLEIAPLICDEEIEDFECYDEMDMVRDETGEVVF